MKAKLSSNVMLAVCKKIWNGLFPFIRKLYSFLKDKTSMTIEEELFLKMNLKMIRYTFFVLLAMGLAELHLS